MGEDIGGQRFEVGNQRLVVDVGRRSPRNKGESQMRGGRECNSNEGAGKGRERHGRKGREGRGSDRGGRERRGADRGRWRGEAHQEIEEPCNTFMGELGEDVIDGLMKVVWGIGPSLIRDDVTYRANRHTNGEVVGLIEHECGISLSKADSGFLNVLDDLGQTYDAIPTNKVEPTGNPEFNQSSQIYPLELLRHWMMLFMGTLQVT
ncbi:hypothetical protein Sjap_023145 [Stephania japonica]|uniref:Uncharacterized protein n=1 Tax=Stephania japonica TaxID=461633 RepID=A0AAP0HIR1_9MAGN